MARNIITKKELKQIAKRELAKADKEWSLAVKERDKKCIVCGISTGRLNAHHVIGREFKEFRHNLENGVTLCVKHHKFGVFSAHRNGIWFYGVLWAKVPEQMYKINKMMIRLVSENLLEV